MSSSTFGRGRPAVPPSGAHLAARRSLLRLLSVGLGLLGGWLLVELLLALWWAPPLVGPRVLANLEDPTVTFGCYATNPHGELGPVPDIIATEWRLSEATAGLDVVSLDRLGETPFCVNMTNSHQGLRDRDYARRPPPGVVRIMGVGDSFALGAGVPLRRSLFSRIATLLGPGYQVVNGAQMAADTAWVLRRLDELSHRFEHSRTLLIYNLNDIGISAELEGRRNRIISARDHARRELATVFRRPWFRPASRLAALVRSQLAARRRERETIELYADAHDAAKNPTGLAALEASLRALAERRGSRVAVVLYPLPIGMHDYPLRGAHRTVAAIARKVGLAVFDAAPALAGNDAASLRVHPLDHHPNGRAHGIVARAIVGWLRREQPGFLARDPR